MRKTLFPILALVLCLSMLAACGTPAAPPAAEAGSEGEASSVAPSGADPAPQNPPKVLLAVSFGTSYNDNRELTIGAIERALQEANPEWEVRRAFTSQVIIDKLKNRDNLTIDNVTEAMERLVADGVREVIVQPTHVMNGFEYDDVIAEIAPYQERFDSLRVGAPLLISDADFDRVAGILAEETKAYQADGTAIVLMGHGTEHAANAAYGKLQKHVDAAGYRNLFIGTVEAAPTLEDLLPLVRESGAQKVVLLPLMIVAGDHANNDMAGDEDSWKSALEAEGYEVEYLLRGLGEYAGIQEMFVAHAAAAVELDEAVPQGQAEAPAPLGGDRLRDGTYPIAVSSSSSMFRVVEASLTVAGGEMTAVLTLSGTGYGMLYMGTGQAALAATEDRYIPFVETADGKYTYEVPVAALDQEIDVAAWSINKETWYDRVLVFESALLPEDAYRAE